MIMHEKANQVVPLLRETNLDCWLIFARETFIHPDPGMDLVVGADVVRNSAFLFGRGGERIGITARFDVTGVRDGGVFDEVIGYDEDIRPDLLAVLQRLSPATIGLNYSLDDVTADGLTHGHWLLLQNLLRDTAFASRLSSAGPLLSRLRGRKTPGELARIRKAVEITEEIVGLLTGYLRIGQSEKQIADFFHQEFHVRGLETSWPADSCPIVNAGPNSEPGHSRPRSDLFIESGQLLHIDLGVKYEGYCSDLQRMWYIRRPEESGPPDEVRRAFAIVVAAMEAGMRTLRPGVAGHEVDAAARKVIVEARYPEFKHGLGHSLGRAVHDGGTHLGPRWPCYGRRCEAVVEAGNVFTIELGVPTSVGFVGLEEDVLVTTTGCEVLSAFPREPVLV